MITVYVRMSCGCCEEAMRFESVEGTRKAFAEAGLGNVTITDDEGNTFTGIDTFYGFSTEAEEMKDRGLGFLLEAVVKQMS